MDFSVIYQAIPAFVVRLLAAFGILILGFVTIQWILRPIGAHLLRRTRWQPAVISIALSLGTVTAWILVASGVLAALDLTVIAAALSGSIALVALAIANAAKGTTNDIIAGLFLAIDEDLDLGFRVRTGDVEGRVERIDMRKVRIRDDEGRLHVIPNRSVESAPWIVISRDKPPS